MNIRPDAVENADPAYLEAAFLTTDANYTELARRTFQDRGAQGYGNTKLVDMRDPKRGQVVTPKPQTMTFQSYTMPTNRIQFNLQNVTRGLNTHELHQSNVAHVGRENIQKHTRGKEYVENTGYRPGKRLLDSRVQIGEDEGRSGGMRGGIGAVSNSTADSPDNQGWRRSGSALSNMPVSLFPCALQASGTPFDQLSSDMYTYDAYNVDQGLVRGDAKKPLVDVDISGGARTEVEGPVRLQGIGEYRPTNKQVLGTDVGDYGMDCTDHGFAADRFQLRRNFLFDVRPEERSVLASVETSGNGHALLPGPVVRRGREYRQGLDRDITAGHAFRLDTGLMLDTMQPNSANNFSSEAAFYSKLQARQALF